MSTSETPAEGATSTAHGARLRLSTAPSPDLPELREWHVALLRRWDCDIPVRDRREAEDLRTAVQHAGSWIESPADRDAAQGIIDYWTSAIASLPGDDFPGLLQLARFEPENRERWIARADETLEALKSEGLEGTARAVILGLLAEGRSLSDDERGALLLPQADAVRSKLAQSGLLATVDKDGKPTSWLVHEALLRSWPQLTVWLTSLASQSAKFDKARAELQNWEFRKRQSGYLLRGQALRDARPFRGRDPALDEYIKASNRARWLSMLVATLVAVLILVCGYGAYRLGDVNGFDNGKSEGSNVTEAQFRDQVVDAQAAAAAPTDGSAPAEEPTPADGFIWAGSSSTPLLRDARGNPVDPATITQGGRYHTRVDIMLRSELPDQDTYRSKPSVGILPAGALIEVVDRPAQFARDTGTQFWIRVHRVTTVFVQYEGGEAEKAKAQSLIAALTARRYNVAQSPDHQASAARSYQIRFSYAEDLDQAQRLADVLGQVVPPAPSTRARCFMLRSKKRNASGVLEVWIDFRTVDVRTRPIGRPERRLGCDQPLATDAIGATTVAK